MADEMMGGGGAGEQSGGDVSQTTPTPAVEPTSHAEAAEPRVVAQPQGDLEDEDEDVYDEDALIQDREKLRRLIRNRRRDGRFAKENRGLVTRIRESKLDLDDLVTRARNHDALVERIASLDPDLKQRLFSNGPAPRPQEAAPARAEYPGSGLPPMPFDRSDPSGEYLASLHTGYEQLHRQNWEFQQQARSVISALSRELTTLRDGIHGEKSQATTKTWSSAIDAEIAKYDDGIAPYLRDGLVGLFRTLRGANRTDLLQDPAKAIRQYIKDESLAKYRKAPAGKASTAIAQQQRMAADNRARPGAAAYTGGTPAAARPQGRRTVKDVSRELLARR